MAKKKAESKKEVSKPKAKAPAKVVKVESKPAKAKQPVKVEQPKAKAAPVKPKVKAPAFARRGKITYGK